MDQERIDELVLQLKGAQIGINATGQDELARLIGNASFAITALWSELAVRTRHAKYCEKRLDACREALRS